MERFAAAVGLVGVLLLAVSPDPNAWGEADDVDTAIVFAADISWSMDVEELGVVREGHATAIAAPEVLKAISRGAIGRIAVTYVEFAGAARQMVGWQVVDGQAAANRFAAAIRAVEGATQSFTDIGSAFYLADDLFAAMPYRATRRIVDVVGDGIDGSTAWLGATRDVLLARGAVINGLPLVIRPSEAAVAAFYETAVIGGPGAFSLPVQRIGEMPEALRRKIERELF